MSQFFQKKEKKSLFIFAVLVFLDLSDAILKRWHTEHTLHFIRTCIFLVFILERGAVGGDNS